MSFALMLMMVLIRPNSHMLSPLVTTEHMATLAQVPCQPCGPEIMIRAKVC